MSLAQLYQQLRLQDDLYQNSIKTKADHEIIKAIAHEMDEILVVIGQILAYKKEELNNKHTEGKTDSNQNISV